MTYLPLSLIAAFFLGGMFVIGLQGLLKANANDR